MSAIAGRTLTVDDESGRPARNRSRVVSWSYWQRRFAGNPSILTSGHQQRHAMTIVGNAPSGFAGVVSVQSRNLVPLLMKAELTPTWNDLDNRQSRWCPHRRGRWKPGLTAATAKPQLEVVYRQNHEYELVAVPGFAEASQNFKDRFVPSKDLYPAGRGLSDCARWSRLRCMC